MRRGRRAFTMIELLVVVVILGLLAALIFPVFAQARSAAQKATCLSNSREIALASVMYMEDHNDRLFPFGYVEGRAYRTWWGDLNTGAPEAAFIFPYTKSGGIRGCPSARDLPNDAPHTYTMGYGMNFRLFYRYPPEGAIGEFRTVSGSDIDRPAETVLCGDSARWEPNRNSVIGTPYTFGDSWSYHFHARHTGDRANVTWLDGHASSPSLYFHTSPLIGDSTIEPETLRLNRLGDLLKFPKEQPEAGINSIRDQFYFLIEKPAGL
ncbi:prepilin-type N-terminal cleavage/methylation domain-containing protein [bacterium]|nr:MAG: prepilin-type N-terminal cleavage/methylation domain-containing protein [bacterium]